jgi:hypothetical protein
MGGACSTYGRQKKGMQVSGGDICRKDTTLDVRIILKWIFKEWNGGIDQICLVQDMDRWRALVSAVMNVLVP